MNKKIKLSIGLMLSVITLFGFFAVTTPASAMTCDSATLAGNVITGTPPTHARFAYSTNYNTVANGGGTTTAVQYFYNDGTFPIQQFVSGLSQNTTYYFRLEVTNNYGTENLNILNFTTPSCAGAIVPPPVITPPARSPSATITSTQSCTAPCNANVSWTSSNVYNNNPAIVTIYKNGASLWNQAGNISGSQTDWNLPQGTYQYCIRAVTSNWSNTGNLACSTTNVTSPAPVIVPPVNKYATLSINKTAFKVGETWTLSINSNIPNSPVTICSQTPSPSGNSCTPASNLGLPSSTNSSGSWYAAGIPTNAEIGSWDEYAVISGTNSNHVYFTVSGNQIIPQVCQDTSAINYGGALPCRYNQIIYPTVNISANPTFVSYNGASTLTWNSNNATSCSASSGVNGWSGLKSTSGTFYTGALTNTTTYNITCTNSTGQQANASATVTVAGQVIPQVCQDTSATNYGGSLPCRYNQIVYPTVNLSANPLSVSYNGASTITWNSNNAISCSASSGVNGWSGLKSTSGTFYTGALTNTTTYNITCTNSTGQQANASVTVNVGHYYNNDQIPNINLSASQTYINSGGSTYINWSPTNNPTYCTGSNGSNSWSGTRSTYNGNFYTGQLYNTTTYTMTCGNNAGSATESVSVVVNNQQNNNQPSVTTNSATNITNSSATLNGWVNGNSIYTTAWFEYGTNTSFGYSTSQNSYGSGSSSYNANIAGLITNTTYYFRAVAQSSQGLIYGSTLSFNTNNNYIYPPIINTQPTVVVFANEASVAYNGSATVSWITTNATSCNASGGSVGWAGTKSIGPGSFYTGSLTSSRTYTLTCSNNFGSVADSATINVRGRIITNPVIPTSLVLITSSVDRNQPIVPTIDNTRPRPGDEINYTVSYQNVGTGSITGLTLRINLPYEVDYMFSNPSNPIRSGNTLIFNLGTLRANGEGTVTARVKVRENIPTGTNLNFPATLSYIDPSGSPQSVNANVSAQVWSEPVAPEVVEKISLGANVFGAGFLPENIFGWLLLFILMLILVLLTKYLFGESFNKKTTTTIDQPLGKKTTTTTIE
ncbi:MAG: hypothetical protein WC884_03415 [Candidatus Paceibacterota bacterium]